MGPTEQDGADTVTRVGVTLDTAVSPGPAGGSPDASAASPRAPPGLWRLNHYLVLGKLGEGGMGVVYAAFDERLERKVALKLLHTRGHTLTQQRLIREAQAMARVSHRNVAQIYEIGEVEQQVFIVMEFIDGQTLRRWRDERPRTRDELLAVFFSAGRGLAAAHAKGLVHRDFKPENVMVAHDGRVLVLDFGLARLDETLADITQTDEAPAFSSQEELTNSNLTTVGTRVGTPAYMAPEQFLAKPTGAHTDQFSFCVALWEALYDERPFRGSGLAELERSVVLGSPQEPQRASEVPLWLRGVIERGLARQGEQRWPSMEALLDALASDPTMRRRRWLVAFVTLTLLLQHANLRASARPRAPLPRRDAH